jgi:hypothetical protein
VGRFLKLAYAPTCAKAPTSHLGANRAKSNIG